MSDIKRMRNTSVTLAMIKALADNAGLSVRQVLGSWVVAHRGAELVLWWEDDPDDPGWDYTLRIPGEDDRSSTLDGLFHLRGLLYRDLLGLQVNSLNYPDKWGNGMADE